MSKPYSVLPLKFKNLEKELYAENHVYCVSQLNLPLSGKAKEFI